VSAKKALLSGFLSVHRVCSSSHRQILLPRYLENSLSDLDEADWIPEVKGQGRSRPSRSNLVNTIFHEQIEFTWCVWPRW